jgi:hypothetical protein
MGAGRGRRRKEEATEVATFFCLHCAVTCHVTCLSAVVASERIPTALKRG